MRTSMLARARIVNSPEPETPPRLHGDGVTDDTDAVQWYMDRQLELPEAPPGPGYSVRLHDLRQFAGGYVGFVRGSEPLIAPSTRDVADLDEQR